MKANAAYRWLKNTSLEINYLGSLGALAAWDQRTYIPQKGHQHRAGQLATLAKLLHKKATDPEIGECLSILETESAGRDPNSVEAANIREWRREYDRSVKIPARLAEELARTTSECETLWETTRAANDWKTFAPKLKSVFTLLKEKAEAIGYEKEAYDALLDEYEPGETTASIEPTFTRLKAALTELIKKIANSNVTPETDIMHRPFDIEQQEAFGKKIAAAIGYDFNTGRLDRSIHPFTTGIGPGDVRITTRYQEDYFQDALFSTIHEAGHGLYEQGLPAEHWGTPAGIAVSLGIHESQSRLWENMVGRSRGFWKHFFPMAKAAFASLKDVDMESFLLALNAVKPSLIRVDADEVTYNLHILLRFELELKIMRGDLAIEDLPDAWNEGMQNTLGVTPKDIANGPMQDVHWSAGLVGYFPTYTLGNLNSAQLYRAAEKEWGNLEEMFGKGEFKPLLSWLRTHIHKKGARLRPRDLMVDATGEDLNPSYFINYCEEKYKGLYQL